MKKVIILCILIAGGNIYAQIKIGEKAPELFLEEIYNSNNPEIPTLKDWEDNIVVLYFWATWCKPCVSSFQKINELHKKYEKENVKIIAVTDDEKERLEAFLSKANADFLIGRDNSKKTFTNYNVSTRPNIYILDKQGIVIYQGSEISEEMIEEVLATNQISSNNFIRNEIITFGGFSPGEDPLYNAMCIMHSGRDDYNYKLIEQFIIRPSLEKEFWGYGCKFHQGYAGFTYSGGDLADIFAFLYDKTSKNWIKNNTQDTDLYDIVYWRKAESLNQAYQEIEESLLDGLSFKIDTVVVEQNVNILYVSRDNDSLQTELGWETMNLYMKIEQIISSLEEKSGHYFIADDSAENMFIYNNEMDWEKLNTATADELIDFLKRRGIGIKVEKKEIVLLELNKR